MSSSESGAEGFAPWVVIVGAGPVGLIAANLLGSLGVPTLLVEQNEGLSGQPKALMVDDEFYRLLNALDLGQALAAHGVGPVSFDVFSPFGFRVAHIAGRISDHGFPTRTAMFQPEFERILLRGIERHDNVQVRFGTRLLSFADQGDHIELALQGSDGTSQTLRARYLLAADGSHSPVRKALDIPFDELVKFGQRQIVVDVKDDPDTSLVAVSKLGFRRNFISLPTPNGRRYEFSIRPQEDAEDLLDDASLTRLFKPHGLDYGQMQCIRKVVYTFHSRLARRLQQGRVFLLGDAAHIMPVFGSQGMNSGARDANNLAWKLAAVYHGRADAALLDTYHTERHRHAGETIRIATANGKLQSVRQLPVALLRDLALGALSLVPPLRRYVAEMRYIPKPYLHEGVVQHVSAEPQTDTALTGRVLPAAWVITPDGKTRLDDAIGMGFALVGIAPVEAESSLAWLEHGVWKTLQPRILTLHDDDGSPRLPGVDGLTVVDGPLRALLAAHRGKWLILRPDRVVAAIGDGPTLADITQRFADQIGWRLPQRRLAA